MWPGWRILGLSVELPGASEAVNSVVGGDVHGWRLHGIIVGGAPVLQIVVQNNVAV